MPLRALLLLGTYIALGGCTLLLSTSGFDDLDHAVDDDSSTMTSSDASVDDPHDADDESANDDDVVVEDGRAPTLVTQPDAGDVWASNGHRYQVVTYSGWLTWFEARNDAVAAGGYLATITSAGEFDFVTELVKEHFDGAGNWVWVGAYQPNPTPDIEPDGNWEWVTGEPWFFTRWSPNQPNNWNKNQHYLFISSLDGRWNDVDVNGEKKIVDAVFEFDD